MPLPLPLPLSLPWLQSFSDTEGAAACTPCPANSATLERGSKSISACTCLPGFYYAGTPGQACEPCPEGAQCLGGSRPPYPQPGYWTNTSSLQSIGEVRHPTLTAAGARGAAQGRSARQAPSPCPPASLPYCRLSCLARPLALRGAGSDPSPRRPPRHPCDNTARAGVPVQPVSKLRRRPRLGVRLQLRRRP